MNYLKISNSGLICPEDLMLIGSSTKREQSNKIGMFGSGWKYALAWMLRNDCKPTIFSGTNQINVDFNVKMHRTNAVNVITVNGVDTSLTTEMGPKWTGWMALREVLSNAIDEGNHSITTVWSPEFTGIPEVTTIYIPMSSELAEVMLKFDSYFAFYRRESYSNDICRMFFKTEPSPLNIYRKGIRCYDTNSLSRIDFDFNEIHISEDRLTSDKAIDESIKSMISKGMPISILKRIIQEEKQTWLPYTLTDELVENLIELAKTGEQFTTETLRRMGGILFSAPNSLCVPASWYQKLDDLGLVKSPFEKLGGCYNFIRTDAKNLQGFTYYLNGFNISMPCYSGKCETDVFYHNGVAYVNDETKVGDKELVGKLFYSMGVHDFVDYMK